MRNNLELILSLIKVEKFFMSLRSLIKNFLQVKLKILMNIGEAEARINNEKEQMLSVIDGVVCLVLALKINNLRNRYI